MDFFLRIYSFSSASSESERKTWTSRPKVVEISLHWIIPILLLKDLPALGTTARNNDFIANGNVTPPNSIQIVKSAFYFYDSARTCCGDCTVYGSHVYGSGRSATQGVVTDTCHIYENHVPNLTQAPIGR